MARRVRPSTINFYWKFNYKCWLYIIRIFYYTNILYSTAVKTKHPVAFYMQRGVNLNLTAANYADCFALLQVNTKTQITIKAVLTIKGIQGLATKPATI